jgi:hypothetical protein
MLEPAGFLYSVVDRGDLQEGLHLSISRQEDLHLGIGRQEDLHS